MNQGRITSFQGRFRRVMIIQRTGMVSSTLHYRFYRHLSIPVNKLRFFMELRWTTLMGNFDANFAPIKSNQFNYSSIRRVIRNIPVYCSYKYTTPAQGNPFLSDESFKYHSEGQRVTTDHPFYTQSQPLNAFGQSQAWWTNRWLLWYWVAGVGWERFEIVLDTILKMFL